MAAQRGRRMKKVQVSAKWYNLPEERLLKIFQYNIILHKHIDAELLYQINIDKYYLNIL